MKNPSGVVLALCKIIIWGMGRCSAILTLLRMTKSLLLTSGRFLLYSKIYIFIPLTVIRIVQPVQSIHQKPLKYLKKTDKNKANTYRFPRTIQPLFELSPCSRKLNVVLICSKDNPVQREENWRGWGVCSSRKSMMADLGGYRGNMPNKGTS